VLRDFNRELELKIAPLDLPGAYRLIVHAAALRDAGGNVLASADIVRTFTILRYSISWIRLDTGSWFTPTNWIPQRVPGPKDWVYIGVKDTNSAVHIYNRTLLTSGAPELEKVHVRSLESELDLALFYAELQTDEPLLANGWLYLSASKLKDTVLVAGPKFGLGYTRGFSDPFVTKEGYFAALDGVKIQGDVQLTTGYHLLNHFTLEGNMYGRLDRNVNKTGVLNATRDTLIDGPGTFVDVPLLAKAGELNEPSRPGPLVTIGPDVTFRGALEIGLEGAGSRLLNRGRLLADEPLPGAGGRYYSAINMVPGPGEQSITNQGTIAVSNGYRLFISGSSNSRLVNRGSLKAADKGFLWFGVPLSSPRIQCDAGGVVQLSDRLAPWITAPDQVSELSGPGRWFARDTEFQGGTVRLTEGAVLEGSAVFNNVIFEGELHNYDWNTRQAALPDYLTPYGNQVQVGTNLTLNGLIVFHRQSALENGARLAFLGNQSRLDGRGHVEFEQTSRFNQIVPLGFADASATLTIGPNITIHGNALTLGKIRGVDSGSLPFIENQGTVTMQPGDALKLGTDVFTNSGLIHIAATNAVTAEFNFTQTSTGRVEFEGSSTSAGLATGRLVIPGAASLDGAVQLIAVPPLSIRTGDSLELLTYGSLKGRFSAVQTPAAPLGLQYKPDYGPKSFRLQVGAADARP
jgi:hypothetical protein